MKPKLTMRARYKPVPRPRHPYIMYYLLASLFAVSLIAQLLIKIFK